MTHKKIAIALLALAAIVGLYYFMKRSTGYGNLLVNGYGNLLVNGSNGTVSVNHNASLSWSVAGMTPGALIQFGFDSNGDPATGFSIADTKTADATGAASGSVQLIPGTHDYPGAQFYAYAYDTAIGSMSGYSKGIVVKVTS